MKLPELDSTGMSAKTIAALKAIKPTKNREAAARTVTALAGALTKADIPILAAAFERTATAFAKFARTPAWQRLARAPRDKLLWLLRHVACALRMKEPERMVAFVVSLPSSWPRTELFEVLTGLYGAPTIGQAALAKLVDMRTFDRLDLYIGFEALYATDQKKFRTMLRRPAKGSRDKLLLDVMCDVIERKSEDLADWLPDLYPHVIAVDTVRITVEGEPEDYEGYLAWAQKHVDRRALAKYLRARVPELRYNGRAWVAAVRPALAAVAKKLDDAKLASAISNLDLG